MSRIVGGGTYSGIDYVVIEEDDETRDIFVKAAAKRFIAAGANPELLNNIGDKDPNEVMREFFNSAPEIKY